MRKLLVITTLIFCFCNVSFADQPTATTTVKGNQGYIQGSPEAASPTTTATPSPSTDSGTVNPIRGIIRGIWKVDAWIQQNIW